MVLDGVGLLLFWPLGLVGGLFVWSFERFFDRWFAWLFVPFVGSISVHAVPSMDGQTAWSSCKEVKISSSDKLREAKICECFTMRKSVAGCFRLHSCVWFDSCGTEVLQHFRTWTDYICTVRKFNFGENLLQGRNDQINESSERTKQVIAQFAHTNGCHLWRRDGMVLAVSQCPSVPEWFPGAAIQRINRAQSWGNEENQWSLTEK